MVQQTEVVSQNKRCMVKEDAVEMKAKRYADFCAEEWFVSSSSTPLNLRSQSKLRRWKNERRCKKLLKRTEAFGALREKQQLTNNKRKRQEAKYCKFLGSVLGFSPDEAGLIMQKACGDATVVFIRMAKRFDPEMQAPEIYQACRNVWMINALQMAMDMPVEVSPAIFAYSLLYPYTDNFLDNPAITGAEKRRYFEVFHERLKGIEQVPESDVQHKIFQLISQIEEQYPRHKYPDVYASLIEIHRAQHRSLDLLKSNKELSEDDVKQRVFHKGGTSVLADGYLIKGALTEDEGKGCYAFGVLLQLLDDWQDVEEDRTAGITTLFSAIKSQDEMALLLNKTLNFTTQITGQHHYFKTSNELNVLQLIQKSCQFYMLNSVSKHASVFNESYRNSMGQFLPFRMVQSTPKRKQLIYDYIRNC